MRNHYFIGREKEIERLSTLHQKKSASLVVIKGRRRIGKSSLIEKFAEGKKLYSFAGIPPTEEVTAKDQQQIFAKQFAKQTGLQNLGHQDWDTLFSLLARETTKGKVIILLDEISWMGSKDPTFLGKLKNAWDLEFKKNPQLILVLCGSVSTWIEENIINHTAFFGRISLLLQIEELPLNESHQFIVEKGFRGSIYEEFKVLGVTGGIPWYLEQIHSGKNADDTIRDLCFRSDGVLFREFESIFHDLFEKRSKIYRPIVEALACSPLEFNAICKKLNYTRSGTLSGYLDDLMQSGFITRDFTWSIKSGKPSKLSCFRLSDNYLRFYLKYISPNRDRILRGAFEEEPLKHLPGWNTIMGLQFENLVLKNRKLIWKQLGIHPGDIVADNPYFQTRTTQRKSCQIDYLIQTRYNTLFACEIKFSLNPIPSSIIEEMQKKLVRIATPKHFSCWPVLIHVNGISDGLHDSDYFTKVIDFADLLR